MMKYGLNIFIFVFMLSLEAFSVELNMSQIVLTPQSQTADLQIYNDQPFDVLYTVNFQHYDMNEKGRLIDSLNSKYSLVPWVQVSGSILLKGHEEGVLKIALKGEVPVDLDMHAHLILTSHAQQGLSYSVGIPVLYKNLNVHTVGVENLELVEKWLDVSYEKLSKNAYETYWVELVRQGESHAQLAYLQKFYSGVQRLERSLRLPAKLDKGDYELRIYTNKDKATLVTVHGFKV